MNSQRSIPSYGLAVFLLGFWSAAWAGCDAPAKVITPREETWDVCLIGDSRVGYVRTLIEPQFVNGVEQVRIEVENELTLKRFGQLATQRTLLTSIETPDHKLRRFESRVTAGREETIGEGEVVDGRLLLKTITPGKTEESKLIWKETFGGYFAAEHSLRDQPMKPGETRTLKVLVPIFNQLGDVLLEAQDFEKTKLLGDTQRLLKIRKTDLIGTTKIESWLWMDQEGNALKSLVPSLNLEAFRTTKAEALKNDSPITFDLGESSVVRIAKSLREPHQTQRAVYMAQLNQGDIADVFSAGASQKIERIDEKSAKITVLSLRPDRPTTLEKPEVPPTDEDLSANSYIQSDAPKIVKMAKSIAENENDPWVVAQAVEKFVQQSIRKKNFSQALATAAEVAETLEGDCTEHSVLLAALCRARKIPARVAVGLVYYRPVSGFAYHMWNEVWIKDRWVPLDGTLGLGGIGAAHLKLGTSNLQGANSLNLFLPVVNVIGNLKLELIEVQP